LASEILGSLRLVSRPFDPPILNPSVMARTESQLTVEQLKFQFAKELHLT
jgi:hypothetical protein